jgi:hypothetical protein
MGIGWEVGNNGGCGCSVMLALWVRKVELQVVMCVMCCAKQLCCDTTTEETSCYLVSSRKGLSLRCY